MKKLIYLLGLAMLMAVAACSGSAEKKKSDIRVLMQDSTDAHGVQRMTARKSEVDIKYKGKEYHSFISRTPGRKRSLHIQIKKENRSGICP